MVYVLLSFVCCTKTEKIEQEELEQAVENYNEIHAAPQTEAVINVHNLGFRKKLGASYKTANDWWAPLEIGEKVVILSNEPVEDANKTKYLEIQRVEEPDETGFVSVYYVSPSSQLAVVVGKDAIRYSKQRATGITKDTLPFGALVAINPETERDGLVQFDYTTEAYRAVYRGSFIEKSQISTDEKDIEAAKFILLAKLNPDKTVKARFLQKAQEVDSILTTIAHQYLAVVKNNFADFMSAGDIKQCVKPLKMSVNEAVNVNYRTWYGDFGLILGQLPKDKEITLTYQTTAPIIFKDEESIWYFAEGYGWVSGAVVENMIGQKPAETPKSASEDL